MGGRGTGRIKNTEEREKVKSNMDTSLFIHPYHFKTVPVSPSCLIQYVIRIDFNKFSNSGILCVASIESHVQAGGFVLGQIVTAYKETLTGSTPAALEFSLEACQWS